MSEEDPSDRRAQLRSEILAMLPSISAAALHPDQLDKQLSRLEALRGCLVAWDRVYRAEFEALDARRRVAAAGIAHLQQLVLEHEQEDAGHPELAGTLPELLQQAKGEVIDLALTVDRLVDLEADLHRIHDAWTEQMRIEFPEFAAVFMRTDKSDRPPVFDKDQTDFLRGLGLHLDFGLPEGGPV